MAEFNDRQLADVWTGTGDISLFAARGEELADLAPRAHRRRFPRLDVLQRDGRAPAGRVAGPTPPTVP